MPASATSLKTRATSAEIFLAAHASAIATKLDPLPEPRMPRRSLRSLMKALVVAEAVFHKQKACFPCAIGVFSRFAGAIELLPSGRERVSEGEYPDGGFVGFQRGPGGKVRRGLDHVVRIGYSHELKRELISIQSRTDQASRAVHIERGGR